MTLSRVRLADATPQPWRNGGGVTRELLAWTAPGLRPPNGEPRGRTATAPALEAWTVRVSVADIDRDGPFSPFAGIDRAFTVLEGAGVVLSFAGDERRLDPATDPLSFDGGLAPGCRLVDGRTRDLNLMVRASAGRARMGRAVPGEVFDVATPWRALYAHGPARVDLGHGATSIEAPTLCWQADDAARLGSAVTPAATAWRVLEGGPAWWLWVDAPQADPSHGGPLAPSGIARGSP